MKKKKKWPDGSLMIIQIYLLNTPESPGTVTTELYDRPHNKGREGLQCKQKTP